MKDTALTDSPAPLPPPVDIAADAARWAAEGEPERQAKIRRAAVNEVLAADAAHAPLHTFSTLFATLAQRTADAAPRPPPPPSWADRAASAVDRMLLRASGRERPIPTPWRSVNVKMRGGLWPGLYTLSGGTGTGKTQWAMECALDAAMNSRDDAARTGKPPRKVVYIALELGDMDLVARLLSLLAAHEIDERREAGETEYQIRDTGLSHLKWSDLFFGAGESCSDPMACDRAMTLHRLAVRYLPALQALPIHVETADAIGFSHVDLERLAAEHAPSLMVIDYTQLMGPAPDARGEDLRETIGNVAKKARDIARRPGGPAILALSSVARANYAAVGGATTAKDKATDFKLGKGDPSALVGIGKESGELEFCADAALVLAREPLPDLPEGATAAEVSAAHANRITWFAIAKGRGFAPDWVAMRFDGNRYTEADPDRMGAYAARAPIASAATTAATRGNAALSASAMQDMYDDA